ncbi:hypothetical protein [Stenotrophomonas sp. MMGLT7]|uniref:hypothetical protein n=1 Tax=Stenotrophomonas sp. MMGLT7 TaxID=2901227 RepID=UPI001E47FF44|nr:hypothetical protein [Stenotrophomonas sp. MMGLT7]MCD7096936.1 hypothetical protein [Stenotrophomonas sp. MMGLT7]
MFRFADLGREWVPVELPQGEETATVHLLMTLMTRKELRARERRITERTGARLVQDAPAVKSVEELMRVFDSVADTEDGDATLLAERVHGWKGFETTAGEPLEFSPDRFEALLGFDHLFKPIRQAYFQASREGVAKNSQPGPGGSPARVQA